MLRVHLTRLLATLLLFAPGLAFVGFASVPQLPPPPERIPDLVRALQSKNPQIQLAAALLMSDLAQKSEKSDLLLQELRHAGAHLPDLLKSPNVDVQAAAITAIGYVRPRRDYVLHRLGLSGPAFAEAMKLRSPVVRLAATNAIGAHIDRTLEETRSATLPEQRLPLMQELVEDATAFAGSLVVALQDSRPDIRAAALQSGYMLFASVGELERLVEVTEVGEGGSSYAAVRAALGPLARRLAPLTASAGRLLRSSDSAEQLGAARMIEEAAELVRAQPGRTISGFLVNPKLAPEGQQAAILVSAELARLEPALGQAIAKGNDSVQLAVLDALESFGPTARSLTPVVRQALADEDRFVRWAAARTLAHIDSAADPASAAALGRLLADSDYDVRLVALDSLERFGPKGAPALPFLEKMLSRPDAELKIAALKTMRALGPAARPIVPAVTALLKDYDVRVRRAAPALLGSLGAGAKSAVPALEAAMRDSDADVRQAAGAAILQILAP